MLNKSIQNQNSCEAGEQLVSYLYDEINSAEKVKFESHLQHCSVCTEELSNFGIVRSSILEWSSLEFSNIKTPLIEIPIDQNRNIGNDAPSQTWLDKLYNAFTFKPAFTAVCCLLFVGIAVTFFALSFTKADETAQNINANVNNSDFNALSAVENTLEPQKQDAESQNSKTFLEQNNFSDLPNQTKDSKAETKQAKSSLGNKSLKSKSLTNKDEITDSINREQNKNIKVLIKPLKKSSTVIKLPIPVYSSVGVDVEDDKSVRLADLFDEIDSK